MKSWPNYSFEFWNYWTTSSRVTYLFLIFFSFLLKIVVTNEEPLSAVSDITNENDDSSSDLDDTTGIKSSPGFFVGKNGTTVELLGQDLWKKFHKLGTEMIITKAGR